MWRHRKIFFFLNEKNKFFQLGPVISIFYKLMQFLKFRNIKMKTCYYGLIVCKSYGKFWQFWQFYNSSVPYLRHTLLDCIYEKLWGQTMSLTAYLATLIGFPIHQSRVCLPCLKKRLGPSLFCLFQEYAENWRNLTGWFRRLETLTHRKSKPNRCIGVFFTPNSIRVFVTSNQNKARKKKNLWKWWHESFVSVLFHVCEILLFDY